MRFDTVIVVDWSAAQGVRRAERDAIWIGVTRDGTPRTPLHMPTRREAEAWLAETLRAEIATGRRVMAAFDFPFGYPAGFAGQVTGTNDPLVLWDWLEAAITDDARGANNRYDVAERLNALFPGEGPFWGKPPTWDAEGRYPGIPPTKKGRVAFAPMGEWRACDRAAKAASSCFQLSGAQSVGGQALMGLPMLARLRRIEGVAVWPFEDWRAAPAVLTEIWPGLIEGAIPRDGIRDRHQVRLLSHALAALSTGDLAAMMEVEAPEEAWVLGAGHRDRLTDLALTAPPEAPLAPPPLSNDCFALPPGVDWTPVDEALSLLRDRLRPVTGAETVAASDASGRILAEAVAARRANPPAPNAAVDGYGFTHADDMLTTLPLVEGRAAAGAPFGGTVPPGHAVRILTGALLPDGIDTVILEEDTRTDGTAVAFAKPPKPRANTRRAGEDVGAGDDVLPAGHVLRPADLALLAAVGVAEVAARSRLRVGVLSTGDELVAPGATLDPARTYDANRPMLLALVRNWGHAAVDLGHVPDDRTALRDRLDGAGVDAVLTSGGASAGDEDHVSALLREAGALTAWRIALKPGRPLALGMWDGAPVFGLPGNPVAAFVCAALFARPALAALAGAPWIEPQGFEVPAAFEKRKKPGRREYLRARLRDGRAEVFASEGSGRISGLAWAEGLVELPDGAVHIHPGDPVRFLPYSGLGAV